MDESNSFPVHLATGVCGTCLVAAVELDPGTQVAQFDGPTVGSYDQVPETEVRHAIGLEEGEWLIPRTDARYLNHSCNPNCRIGDDLEVVTLSRIAAGQELTISYNRAEPEDYATRPEQYFWDPRWNFLCRCREANCVGLIDRYMLSGFGRRP